MRYLFLIPARGGSKRLPNKNLLELAGKPLIEWTIDFARKIGTNNEILVSTDSAEIANFARRKGVLAPWLRPQELSTDESKTADVALHALQWVEENLFKPDAIVTLQPTSPFRDLQSYLQAQELFEKNFPTSVITVLQHEFKLGSLYMKSGLTSNSVGDKLIIKSEEFSDYLIQIPSGNLYFTSSEDLRVRKSLMSKSFLTIPSCHKYEELDIDTREDFEMATTLAKSFNQFPT
jgi:CMP-N-acetylneuraminic acid synthetase